MTIYEHVLFTPDQSIDDILNKSLVQSRFESSGFFNRDNLKVHDDISIIKTEFEVLRPQYTIFGSFVGEQGKLNSQYTTDKSILNVWAGNLIKEVQSMLNPSCFPAIPFEMPDKEESVKVYLETMATKITTRFDQLMIQDLLGVNYLRKDKNKDGTANNPTEPDLPTDSGRAVRSQQQNLTGMFSQDTGKYLMEELLAAVRNGTEMDRNNEELCVLMPSKAFLAYWSTFAMSHVVSPIMNHTFTCGAFKFISFPTDEFPQPVTGSYGCVILPSNSVKFFIPVGVKQGDIISDNYGMPILDKDQKVQRPILINPFFIRKEQRHGSKDPENSNSTVIIISRKGGVVRYRPEFIQQWNIADSLLPATT